VAREPAIRAARGEDQPGNSQVAGQSRQCVAFAPMSAFVWIIKQALGYYVFSFLYGAKCNIRCDCRYEQTQGTEWQRPKPKIDG